VLLDKNGKQRLAKRKKINKEHVNIVTSNFTQFTAKIKAVQSKKQNSEIIALLCDLKGFRSK
jgi:transcription antitermination factor NusG